MKLIDKDAVDTILRNFWKKDNGLNIAVCNAYNKALQDIQCEIDTLEVKEVDLKKELSYEDYKGFFEKYPDLSDDWGFDEAWIFANYFFELGLKTQKGE